MKFHPDLYQRKKWHTTNGHNLTMFRSLRGKNEYTGYNEPIDAVFKCLLPHKATHFQENSNCLVVGMFVFQLNADDRAHHSEE